MKSVYVMVAVVALLSAGCGGDDKEDSPTAAPPAAATGPGLSIDEARRSDLTEPLLVRGALLVRSGEARLCSALAESYPPQCGEPSLEVEGLRLEDVDGLQEAEGVRWAESVKLLGTVDGETLTVSQTATG